MKLSKLFVRTLKEDPKEAEVISHKLLVRAGMIKKVSSGIYSFLPMGARVLEKIKGIVREELNAAGAQELIMPVVQPAELWQESRRWDKMGAEMLRFKDRNGRDFVLGPTHEEVITDIVRNELKSYKDLPVNLYQIQTKFRDEKRPRFGLMRGREFLMKDGYSFHVDEKSLDLEYHNMYDAYCRIFERCGLKFRPVEADSGNIGGDTTHEFMVLAESGEDEVIYCSHCNYAANVEKAESKLNTIISDEALNTLEKVDTPDKKAIEDVAAFLGVKEDKTVKALIYKVDEVFYMVLIRGDYELNEVKLKNLLKASNVEMATDEQIAELGLHKGYLGPVGMTKLKIVADKTVVEMKNFVTGANEVDKHYVNTNVERDFKINFVGDVRTVKVGEKCPRCSEGELNSARGIEVGQVFKLGIKYSSPMNCLYAALNGELKPMVMGCYGIGVSRTMAAAVEQNYDEFGIVWPIAIAPYHVLVIPANVKDENQMKIATDLYQKLLADKIEAVLDDRDERPGFKFKDADLIGFPLKIIVGKGIVNGKVELKKRKGNIAEEVDLDKVNEYVANFIRG